MRASRALALTAVLGLLTVGLAQPATAGPTAKAAVQATAKGTKTTLAAAHPLAGVPVTLTATVSPKPSGGTITFTSGSTSLCAKATVSTSTGKATCSTTFTTTGTRTISAAYSGVASTWAASTGTSKVTVTSAVGTFVGSVGSCTTTKGALVAVDDKTWQGPIVRGCDPAPSTGIKLLTTAKFTTTGTQHDGPQFLCRIGNPLFDNGTQYPTPATEACVQTPPASAYWSYWLAPKGANTWTYAQFGAYSQKTIDGDVQAWTYGGTDVAGTNGQPSFTPNQVRAGLPTGSTHTMPAQRRAAPAAQAHPSAEAGTVDLDAGAGYLIDGLKNGQYYDPFNIDFPDVGLTIDGAYALAALGNHDTALAKITDWVETHSDNYTGVGTDFAGGGSIGKVALLVEMTGGNPRSVNGHDLIAALDASICATTSTGSDYSCAGGKGSYRYSGSTFSQALGVLAQIRAGDIANAGPAIAFLEGLQYSTGGFPSVLPAGASDQNAETDSTGMAAMALALVPGAKAQAALAKALAWLAGQQTGDGGFPGAAGDSVNSAAISIQALRLDAGTYADNITAAEKFLASEQNSDGGFNVAVGAEDNGSDLRASTQAVGGAVGIPFGSVLDDLSAKAAGTDGADYLVGRLTDGDHYVSSYQDENGNTVSFDDQGLTADGVFSLLAAGGHADSVASMIGYLKGQVGNYADPSGALGGPYSGSLAKLALVAESSGNDPHAFGGSDLLTLLRDNVCTAATSDSSCTAAGDFVSSYSTTSQALGVLALQASPVASDHLTATSPEVVRLHELQCSDGGFSTSLITSGQTCTSDVDTTGYAVQALAAVPGTDNWLGAAQGYLQSVQKSSGLFNGAAGDNSNSTALAAQALQTLVTALSASTADPSNPQTIAPVVTWQSALRGLRGLAVPSGGFGLTANTTADLRASTQAVAAASQQTLLSLSGAQIESLPRVDATAPGGGSSTGPSGGASGGSTSGAPTSGAAGSGNSGSAAAPQGSGSPVAGGSTADTGTPSAQLVLYALLLLLAGGVALFAGRQRMAAALGRHRAAHR